MIEESNPCSLFISSYHPGSVRHVRLALNRSNLRATVFAACKKESITSTKRVSVFNLFVLYYIQVIAIKSGIRCIRELAYVLLPVAFELVALLSFMFTPRISRLYIRDPVTPFLALLARLRNIPVTLLSGTPLKSHENMLCRNLARETTHLPNLSKYISLSHVPYGLSPLSLTLGEAINLRFVDTIFCLSKFAANTYKTKYPHKAIHTYQPCSSTSFYPSPLQTTGTRPRRTLRLITVGNWCIRKGHHLVLEAYLSRLSHLDIMLTHVGLVPQCLNQLKSVYAGDNLRFLGKLKHAKVIEEISNSDILIHPSCSEGYCYAVAEAVSLGIPVISSSFSIAAEYITHQVNGIILKNLCPLEIGSLIVSLYHEPFRLDNLKHGAHHSKHDVNSPTVTSQSLLALISDTHDYDYNNPLH